MAGIKEFWDARVPSGCSRFTQVQVAEMRQLYESGVPQAEIATRFGCTQPNVSDFITGEIPPGRGLGPGS